MRIAQIIAILLVTVLLILSACASPVASPSQQALTPLTKTTPTEQTITPTQTSLLFHCGLCNKLVEVWREHEQSNEHLQNLQATSNPEERYRRLVEHQQKFPDISIVYVDQMQFTHYCYGVYWEQKTEPYEFDFTCVKLPADFCSTLQVSDGTLV